MSDPLERQEPQEVRSSGSTGSVVGGDRAKIADVPWIVVVGALWIVVVDAPRLVSLGPISLSGGITVVLAALTLIMLPAYGFRAAMRWRAGRKVDPARASIPWVFWGFLLFVGVSCVIATVNGDVAINSVQNACVYLLFVGSIAFAAGAKSVAIVLQGWELMRTLATYSAYLMLAVSASGLPLFAKRAMAIAALIVLAVVIPGTPRNIWMKLAPFAAVAAMAVSLSRTSTVIGVACSIFIVLRGKRKGRLVKALSVLALGAVSLLALILFYTPFRDRFLVGDNALQVGSIAISTAGRAEFWKLLLSHASENWFLGHGIGSAGQLIAEHFPYPDKIGPHPHNEYLRLYYEFGIVGLALFVIGYIALFWRSLRSARQTDHPLHWGAVIALLAIGLNAATDNPFVYPFLMMPLGSLAGLSLALARYESLGESTTAANSGSGQDRWRSAIARIRRRTDGVEGRHRA